VADECVTLAEPTESLSEAYVAFLDDFRAAGEPEPFGNSDVSQKTFTAFVRRLRDASRGIGLPEGYVPSSTYWLVRGDRVVGMCNIRHHLSDALRDFGGHVGYSVRPCERGKGYATLMLRLALAKARDLGIDRVLITCGSENAASIRVIEKNGGQLDSESHSPRAGRLTRRYWVDLNEPR
jgi:predicted acetyltransferase